VLLDKGMSCQSVAEVLLLDNDTIRSWYQLYQEDGIEGLASFGHEGGACRLTAQHQDKLKAWITETLPRTTRAVGAWIAGECGIEYQTRSGLIALLHRLGMEHRKPTAISRKLDPVKQAGFITAYETLMNRLSADEAVIFADAVHPTHAVRPVGCWAPKQVPVAVEQSSGRDRLNIHGAVDLETGQTIMKDVLTVDALSTILLLTAIEAMYPGMRWDPRLSGQCQIPSRETGASVAGAAGPPDQTALYSGLLSAPQPDRTAMGADAQTYYPTHNKCYSSFKDFSSAMLNFLRDDVPRNWRTYCDEVTDNFRIINPTEFRIIA
jgi:transposase